MVPIKYGYLIGCLIFLIPWIFIFFKRKDLRKEMLLVSFFVGIGSVITTYLWWTVDWWHPETISGTRVGFEDFILGFANGGVGAVVYEFVFKKRFFSFNDKASKPEGFSIVFFNLSVLSISFWGLSLNSFVASCLAMIASVLLMFYYRRDLLVNGLLSGVLMMVISFPVYLIIELISPGFLDKTWYYHLLSGIRIIGIPIEDLVFYFLFGIWTGPLYEIFYSRKLRNLTK